MLKIIVIGCPGAGKSTFSKKLKEVTNIPLYHLDMIWHKSDKTNISKEEFDLQLNNILKKESWIIDGNYQRTMEKRLKECDTVFLLDIPLKECLMGAENRIGKKREDIPWIETEFDEEFKQQICRFPKDSLPEIYQLLERYKDKNIIIFKSREEANNYLQNISNK